MSDSVLCVAAFTAKKDLADELGQALSALVSPTRSEKGCLSYTLYRGTTDPRLFTMIESYKSQAAFDFHSRQPYLLHFRQIAGDLIEARTVNLYKAVAP